MRSAGWTASRSRASHSRTRVTRVRPGPPPTRPSRPPPSLAGFTRALAYWALAAAALAAGDAATAQDATEAAWQHLSALPADGGRLRVFGAQAALAGGDLIAARRWADDAVATTTGWY